MIIIGLCIFFCTQAQITNSPSNQFSLSTILGNPPLFQAATGNNPSSIAPVPSSAFFFEYGDGYFTSDINSTHNYYSPVGATKTSLLSLSGRYDTMKPPPAFAKYITTDAGNTGGSASQSILTPGKSIGIMPIANSINRRDEMVFVLTYKLPAGATNGKIIFYYNQPNATFFSSINNLSMMTVGVNDATPNSIPRIRTHFGETWGGNITTTPSFVTGMLSDSYSNGLAWSLNTNMSENLERNIFITLPTLDNFTNQLDGKIEAVIIYNQADSTKGIKPGKDTYKFDLVSISLPFSENPHDPNYISVTPKCIKVGSGLTKVNYRVHFQNEGGGPAHRLLVKISMDSTLKEYTNRLNENSFKIKIANKFTTDFTLTKSITENVLSFDIKLINPDNPDSSLSCNKVSMWHCNPLTMGDIYFSLDIPHDKEADLGAFASIVFHNGGKLAMEPVITAPDTLFIRNECIGSLFPLIKRLPIKADSIPGGKKIDPPCINCDNCKTILSLCWWWWLIIIAVALLIALFIARQKNKKKKESNY